MRDRDHDREASPLSCGLLIAAILVSCFLACVTGGRSGAQSMPATVKSFYLFDQTYDHKKKRYRTNDHDGDEL